ncbi:MAG: S-methyl-5-thioribose-1-phosphate isomerase [Gammaproteobacteria bacterium]|nr:S-methyl-5-thioribose-1-phosphate isomerase [Gammaproteobacteria bacterium]|tara:strand:- start:1151 stop:2167 length:1017 start_codon:yes stop_codon:yes gene_type:complete
MTHATPLSITWQDGQLRLLDQRLLPHTVSYLDIENAEQACEAINTLAVRGAPAIGIAAAYGLVVAMDGVDEADSAHFRAELKRNGDYLVSSRPTAVNLAWAVRRLQARAEREPTHGAIRAEAEAIHEEDRAICRGIGEQAKDLIAPNANVLTHCNAGALAVSELGTATAPLYLSHAEGKPFHVYVDETRPLMQGARLTAFELHNAGISVELICDNMAATLMSQSAVDLAIVGTDRVTRNGDVVNKIGTLNLAVLCNHFGVPFYVACPSSTFDPQTPSGAEVVIEERAPEEVLGEHAANVSVRNPAFDVTPNSLVSGIITERGVARAPLGDNLAQLLGT